MKAEKLFSRHPLANGLSLEFWDLSRPMIGDRWLIVLEARITIPVSAATLPPELISQESEIVRALGPEIIFSQRDERTFIDAREFETNLKEIEDRLLALAPSYLGHPEFAGRLIRKRFSEYQEAKRCQRPETRK